MKGRIGRHLLLHALNFADALRRLASQPVATAMTVLVIAVALALPAGLRVAVNNVGALSGIWQGAADFSVYLETEVGDERARELTDALAQRADVAAVTLIPRDEALADFRALSGFGKALDALKHNPLPHTLIVRPADGADPAASARELEALPGVALVQIDTDWVARLRAIVELVSRVVDILTALLAAGVVLVIGNTIRLEIHHRAAEIEVLKLVGATDGFIRRPFLYLGFCYGLGGAAVAELLLAGALILLRGPAAEIAELYGSNFRPAGLSMQEVGVLLGGGAALGWGGAALATARHLRAIEPR